MLLMFFSFFFIILPMIIYFISIFLAKKVKMNMNKMIPFECGFDLISYTRAPFSFLFFLIAIIFLIFDVEIALLIPIIKIFNLSKILNWLFISFFFIVILIFGIFHEWNQGALNWNK